MVPVGAQMAQVRKKYAHRRHCSAQKADSWRRYVGEKPTCAIHAHTCATVWPVEGGARKTGREGVGRMEIPGQARDEGTGGPG